jgi:hypothetical protein
MRMPAGQLLHPDEAEAGPGHVEGLVARPTLAQ